jgi:hypothetical protein
MALVRTELVPLVAAPGRRLPADASAGTAAWATRVVADGVDRSVVRRRVDVLLERHGASLYDYVARLSGDGAAAAAGIVADVLADAALTPLPPLSAADDREVPDPDRLATLDLFARATTRCLGAPSWSARRTSPWNALAGVAARLRRRRRPRRDPAPVATAAGGAGEDGVALDVLRSLPPTQRACVLLREHHRFAYREIAAVLGTSPAAVAPLLASAREALARRCPLPGDGVLPMGPAASRT